jgi:hypothetical protein
MTAKQALLAGVLLLYMNTGTAIADEVVLDDFEQPGTWAASSSDGAWMQVTQEPDREGMVLRIDYDLPSDGGFVILRKQVDLPLPENYAFTFKLRGESPRNNVEFKLVDPQGKDVWWRRIIDFAFPPDWQTITVRKARIVHAWGSRTPLRKVGFIELAISTGNGGKGTVWLDDLRFEEREPASQYRRTAKVTASTSMAGRAPENVLADDRNAGWTSEPQPEDQWLVIDFVRLRDFGGLVIDWDAIDYATSYRVQVSDDAEKWTTAYVNASGKGGREYVYMPDAETRYVRLKLDASSRGQGYGIITIAIQPLEFSDTPNQFFRSMAAESEAGTYPKYLYDKQTYWTVVGVDGDEKNALLNEEGMLEVEKGGFSIEPFLGHGGKLWDWSAVRAVPSLEEGYLPIPSVDWETTPVSLRVTAFASGEPGDSTLYALYTLENRGAAPEHVDLYLALRPFQVDPPWQSLNMVGGVAPIHEIRFEGGIAWVNRDKPVIALAPPAAVGAASFSRGTITDFLREGRLPKYTATSDRFGFASAAMRYTFDLEPGAKAEVALSIPFHPGDSFVPPSDTSAGEAKARLDEVRRRWKAKLGHIVFDLPLEGEAMARTLKSTLAYILLNRGGARIQPGPRNYARSWIRDGSLTSAALLQMGFTQEPRKFIEWYSQFQLPNGKVPCCVDKSGAPDPVSEHDSNGQFVYAVAEIYRYTRDIGFVTEMWPYVVKAVDYLDELRRTRKTDAYRSGDKAKYFGLLPQSISHEGYASKPVHSYWDDFFALRGFKDAAMLADVVGDEENAERFGKLRDEFRTDLHASITKTVEAHSIDYLPGSVELGDFDPSSSAIALDPGGEIANLPPKVVERTFEKYVEIFRGRRDGDGQWDAFSPYEVRNAHALVRLGKRNEAVEVLRYLLANQRPQGWNLWQEILWRDPTAASFIGDMPHTWVASGFVRAVRTLLAYERESDQSIVLAAGVPRSWVIDGRRVAVKRLPTYHGVLNMSLESASPNVLRLRLSGDVRIPAGKLVVRPPLDRPLTAVRVNGEPIDTFTAEEATISVLPANVELESEAAPAPTPAPTTETPPATPAESSGT